MSRPESVPDIIADSKRRCSKIATRGLLWVLLPMVAVMYFGCWIGTLDGWWVPPTVFLVIVVFVMLLALLVMVANAYVEAITKLTKLESDNGDE